MNNFFRKITPTIMKKKLLHIETDAAPSRPRSNEEIVDDLSSSDDEEEITKEHARRCNSSKPQDTKPDENTVPEFEHHNTSSTSEGASSYVQTNHIHITNSKGIQIGHQYIFNAQMPSTKGANETTEEERSQPSKPQPPPPKIERTFSNRNEVKEIDFITIKQEIGPYWREVALQLGLENGTIQQAYEEFKSEGTSEVFYRLMLKWKYSQPRTNTTVGQLCEALWNANETNAANVLSKLYPQK